RLRLLAGGSRDAGTRHTSLRAALDWSYRLLDDRGRVALRRLAVFAGGCTLDAAEDVLSDERLPRADVAAVLADLDERNLVVVRARDGQRRFLLLESVHDYAEEQLTLDAREAELTRSRHLAWCTAHVRAHDVQGDDSAAALDAIFAEWPNLLRALDGAVGTERAADALRLALALDDAWMFRGLHNQARRHYATLCDSPSLSDAERAQALSNYAFASTLAGDHAAAGELLDLASRHAEKAGDATLRMRVLYHRGIWFVEEGRPVDALNPLREGARIALAAGREQSASAFDDVIATALLYSGDAAAAAELYSRANASDRRAGRTHGLVRGLVNEATALLSLGRIEAAQRCADEGLELARALHDPVAESTLRAVAGQAALTRGESIEAVRALRAALTELTPGEIDAHLCELDLADALTVAGDLHAARQAVLSVLDASEQRGVVWLLAQPTLAEVTARLGDLATAAELVAAAEQEYAARGFGWPIAVRRLDRARVAVARSDGG
ncbi:MAG: hypothetical protein QOH89_3508, partial [Pseudonocardiales bacterium]|nr:hypothetical protein [Pseudonocardiales bacterium]